MQKKTRNKKHIVSCEIRTHAHRSGLRPERSALDHSAKLTLTMAANFRKLGCELNILKQNVMILDCFIYLRT